MLENVLENFNNYSILTENLIWWKKPEKKNFRPCENISRFTNGFISKRSIQRRFEMIKMKHENDCITRSQR